jgi:16S rRNA (adenine1518-N6/adenine1519-N6)-dimethyltransferase
VKARKRFGQHFLTDDAVLSRIAEAVHVADNDFILEIGPGHGALTDYLYGRGAGRYVAIEIDRDLVRRLSVDFPNLELIENDILRVDLDQYESARVVGNLPYNISTPLMVKLARWVRALPGGMRDGHFMVQRELARRLCAQPGTKDWGRLSVRVQLAFDVDYLFDVAPESFTPPPKVWSGIVRMLPCRTWAQVTDEQVEQIDDLCKRAFSGRRKKLANSLKHAQINWDKVAVDPGKRADDVSIAEFISLAQAMPAVVKSRGQNG